MKTTILIAAHKSYSMPEDPVYLPIQAGAEINAPLEYAGDNSGENISARNKNFCELTVLYWAWKNLNADFIGLVHYRRHFAGRFALRKRNRILTRQQLAKILKDVPVIMPRKRNYFIESNFSHYVHAHNEQDLTLTRKIISEKYPEYLSAYDTVMKRSSGYRFNMCIMRRDLLDSYCTWLFDILFELEEKLDISGYSPYDARVFGFISERLLDVWIEKNQPPLKTLPVINLEKQNWGRKIFHFLLRKVSAGKLGKVN